MTHALIALVLFMGPLFGAVISLWWFQKYDLPRFLGNPQASKTQLMPLSVGLMLFFFASFMLYVIASQEAALTLAAVMMWGWIVASLGVFFPYFFSKKDKREWQYVPRWVKWYSRTLFVAGFVPFVVAGIWALTKQNEWLGFGMSALVIVVGTLYLRRKKYISDTHIDPTIVKAMQVRMGVSVWFMFISLLFALGLLLGHWFGLW